ncbi:MAG TPA: hypothetical protein VEN95_02690 [Actinomycetota bacterium]|nr:hypothetical protein [Actinomycetota bacterium]
MIARDRFAAEIVEDADVYLAGAMTAEEFADSVWYRAGTLALSFADGERGSVLEEWLQFAHWGDELDQIKLGERPPDDRARIEDELRAAALTLYLNRYNYRRRHGSLGHQSPASRLNNLIGNDT